MLELGASRVDITPRFPLPLAGFEDRTGVFSRVLHPLFARVFYFKSEVGPPIILVSADVIWWANERIDAIIGRIRTQRGLENARVVLHATHNHSGPQTSEVFSPLIGEASSIYLKMLESAVLEGVAEAATASEPVTVERGVGQCGIGIHRRRMVNGRMSMAPNAEGPNDTDCTVIRFRDLSGRAKAVLVHFTCHPTTAAENSVSAEFCGAAMTNIERVLGNGAIAGFLQGCCGDIRPALIVNGQFYRGGDMDVQRLGAELAGVALAVLSRPMEQCQPAPCRSHTTGLPLFFEFPAVLIERSSVPLEMTGITLARNLSLLTFSAEVSVEYGLLVKRISGGATIPVAYTNGMIGYVTTERQLLEGGYESREAFRYFDMPGPFAASTEQRVRQAIRQSLLDFS